MIKTKYYMLECIAPEAWDDVALVEGIAPPVGEISWRLGSRFINPPREPVVVNLHPEYGVQIKELRNVDALLMTRRLHEAFVEAGVSNLDTYSAIIRHPSRNFETSDYVVCNLVGIVATANLKNLFVNGSSTHGINDIDINPIVIDDESVGELLMFRLKENSSAVVVHESVKAALLSKGFSMLTFVSPEEWLG
ncbi:MAG: hypothetical protein JNL74_03875 [Fibrobacteres bacterium]|nr:hypothetical protein [Fibrobacterota bacterium]